MKEIIQKFLDERDLGRPLSCEACPIKAICSLKQVVGPSLGADSSSCRRAWADIREWVDHEETKELKSFLGRNPA